ncbi:MAG TPA: hypothetical protein VF503_27580 [Sphingobium sp.]|uniref:hypothetical protein n=1 Tax=Sphingobium sp. TaxID=1912891 RepID=UPI002ED28970
MRALIPAALLPALLLGACGETSTATRPAVGFTPATRPGATDMVGLDARALQRQFGKPRLDIRDPAARKLQFANDRCILDAYLYPPANNREPVTTYVEARSPTGAPVDSNACAKTLRDGK